MHNTSPGSDPSSGNVGGLALSRPELRLLIVGQIKLLLYRAIVGLPITVSSVLHLAFMVGELEGRQR